jgi:V/A-type H+/Na+-transporting ATPase subunit E
MKELPKAEDKVAYICQALRRETLEPAQQEAERMLAEAEHKREERLEETDRECQARLEKLQNQLAQEQMLFRTSMQHAGKQGIALIKQQIEESLFRPAVTTLVDQASSSPEAVAAFLNGIIQAIEKEGISADIEAILPKTVSPDQVMPLLMKTIQERLKKEGAVRLGSFEGGVQIRLRDKNMVLDLSDKALRELLASFMRESFHNYLFQDE